MAASPQLLNNKELHITFAEFIGIATSLPEFVLCLGKITGLESDVWKARMPLETAHFIPFKQV